MHILGALFICLMLGSVMSLGDVVGSWLFDRRPTTPAPTTNGDDRG